MNNSRQELEVLLKVGLDSVVLKVSKSSSDKEKVGKTHLVMPLKNSRNSSEEGAREEIRGHGSRLNLRLKERT